MLFTAFLLFSAALPEQGQAVGTNFLCRTDDGIAFSVFVPGEPLDEGRSDNRQRLYRAMGLAGVHEVDAVIDTLPDSLTMIWRAEDSAEITLDILRYDREAGTARFRIRRESSPTAPIVTITASDGFCVSRSMDRSFQASRQEGQQ